MIHFEQNLKWDLNAHSGAGESQASAGGVTPEVTAQGTLWASAKDQGCSGLQGCYT